MKRVITKELGLKIVKKLEGKAINTASSAHDIYGIYHETRLVARIGIRRGSEKDKGHDHIPGDIMVGPRFAKDLANCPKSREDWIQALRERGQI